MSSYNIPEVAERVRQLRKLHGYTQEMAAKMLGIDRRSLSHIENGSKGCSLDILLRIREVYHVSMDYLLFGENPGTGALGAWLDVIIQMLTMLRNLL